MVCRFILGRAGSGKTHYCLEQIREELRESSFGTPLIFIVPDQASFLHEKELMDTADIDGFIRARVIGFHYLAWEAVKNYPGQALPCLDDNGKLMVLTELLLNKENELQCFAGSAKNYGFGQKMLAVFNELKMYGIEERFLQSVYEDWQQKDADSHLTKKLHDINLLYGQLSHFMADKYLDPEDNFSLLAESILENDFLAGSKIWIDGFNTFTPQELKVIQALIIKAEEVNLTFTLDKASVAQKLQEEDLFYPVWDSYLKIVTLANDAHVQWQNLFLTGEQGRFVHNEALHFLEQHFYPLSQQSVYTQQTNSIQLLVAANRRQEVRFVAGEIAKLVRKNGYRYRDICVTCRNMTDYEDLLAEAFSEYNIPYFMDSKKELVYHPVAELIRSALEVIDENWHYDAVFRFFKTGLTPLSKDEVDVLEEYCLAHGTKPYHWQEQKEWRYYGRGLKHDNPQHVQQYMQQINLLKNAGSNCLLYFAKQINSQSTVQEITQALKNLLSELNVEEQLLAWEQQAEAQGNLDEALIHKQVWTGINELLEQAETFLADAVLPLSTVRSILDAGLMALSTALIPPAVDMVLGTSLDKSRTPNVKAYFILGANEGVFPAKISPDGMFTSKDRILLAESGCFLAPVAAAKQLAEQFLVYVALSRGSEQLFVSYAVTDNEGSSLKPSVLINRLKQMFPTIQERKFSQELLAADAYEYLTGNLPALAGLIQNLKQVKSGQIINSYWQDVYNWFLENPDYLPLLKMMIDGMYFHGGQEFLQPLTAEKLYGKNIRSSVSRLETFRKCPLNYFATYGLQLQPREIYQVNQLDTGNFFHEAMAKIGRKINAQAISWSEINRAKAAALAKETVVELLPDFLGDILHSSARYHYLAQRMEKTITLAVHTLAEQIKRGDFQPLAWEIGFGFQNELPALKIPLPHGGTLEIMGRIDRIDGAVGADKYWVRVVDYKSGAETISVEDIFYGVRLQLLTYLYVAMSNHLIVSSEKEIDGAGIYYFSFLDKMSGSKMKSDEEYYLPGLKMAGITVKDKEAVLLADKQISGQSGILPIYLKQDGQFGVGGGGVEPAEFKLLQKHLLNILATTAQQLLDGLVKASPLKTKYDNCLYCNYQAVCGFDKIFAEVHENPPISPEAMWQNIAKEPKISPLGTITTHSKTICKQQVNVSTDTLTAASVLPTDNRVQQTNKASEESKQLSTTIAESQEQVNLFSFLQQDKGEQVDE